MRSVADDGIVVVEVRKADVVELHAVPPALRSALGPDATQALLEVLERSHQDARPAMIAACTERFERRLVEELSRLRVEMTQQGAGLRQEMSQLGASLRAEMAAGRVEMIKWSFLFWVGQVIAIAGLMGVLLRTLR